MNDTQLVELRLLKIRNAIADKERYIANANRELSLGGWLSDWNEAFRECDREIERQETLIQKGQ